MTGTLKRKFIRAAMTAVTLVMALFLVIINVSNYAVSVREAGQTLRILMGGDAFRTNPGERGGKPDTDRFAGQDAENGAEDAGENGSGEAGRRDSDEKGGSLPDEASREQYISVRATGTGKVLSSEFHNLPAMTEEEVQDLVDGAERVSAPAGRVGSYRFARKRETEPMGHDYIFLNTAELRASFVRVLVLTLLAGGICWLLVLFLVIGMSRKAIAPIALSIERQKQFVTDAGHEIKTPLAIIRANADVLELHGGSSKWIDNIRSQTDRLASLTQNMLLLSRMEEDGMGAAEEPVMAAGLVRELIRPFSEPAQMRGIDVLAELPDDREILLPKDAFGRLLTILLENAVKYAKQDGFIRISLAYVRKKEGCPRGLELRAANNCDSLPEAAPERLFDRFYRDDASRSSKSGGSGIGLSVARAIAEGMGGSLKARYLPDEVIEFVISL